MVVFHILNKDLGDIVTLLQCYIVSARMSLRRHGLR